MANVVSALPAVGGEERESCWTISKPARHISAPTHRANDKALEQAGITTFFTQCGTELTSRKNPLRYLESWSPSIRSLFTIFRDSISAWKKMDCIVDALNLIKYRSGFFSWSWYCLRERLLESSSNKTLIILFCYIASLRFRHYKGPDAGYVRWVSQLVEMSPWSVLFLRRHIKIWMNNYNWSHFSPWDYRFYTAKVCP